MVSREEAKWFGREFHNYKVLVDTVTTTDGSRNDQIDISLQKFKEFTTSGDIRGIDTVCFSFVGGIVRVHFTDPEEKFDEAILRIAKNIRERRERDDRISKLLEEESEG